MRSRMFPLVATIVVLAALYMIAWQRFPAFGTTRVLTNILMDKSFLGIVAIGMTFVILSGNGGIDLSVGSVVAFTGAFIALMLRDTDLHPFVVFAMILTIGTIFGATQGAIIHYFKIPPFIVTLSGLFLARGMTFVLTQDSVPVEHPLYSQLNPVLVRFPDGGNLRALGVLLLIVVAIAIFLAHFTRFGRNVYAIGGNENAALLMGVPVARTKVTAYALCGFCSTLAGIVYSISLRSANPLAVTGLELDAIAAVVIGGTLLTGGVGYVAGTFIGVVIQGVIQTYINFDGSLNSWWAKIAVGMLLFLFIVLQKVLTSRRVVSANGNVGKLKAEPQPSSTS